MPGTSHVSAKTMQMETSLNKQTNKKHKKTNKQKQNKANKQTIKTPPPPPPHTHTLTYFSIITTNISNHTSAFLTSNVFRKFFPRDGCLTGIDLNGSKPKTREATGNFL